MVNVCEGGIAEVVTLLEGRVNVCEGAIADVATLFEGRLRVNV